MKLVRFGDSQQALFAHRQGRLCLLIAGTDNGQVACRCFARKLEDQVRTRGREQAARCFAGLVEIAVPVLAQGQPVAGLICGEFFTYPRRCSFASWLAKLNGMGIQLDARQARKAFRRTAVLAPQRIRALRNLLRDLAGHLQQNGAASPLNHAARELPCVSCAKFFAEHHLQDNARISAAARQAHVTSAYLCRVFKAATNMTYSEYVSRLRLEKTLQLLADRNWRISEIAYAVGFKSIPHFNHIFKRFVGISPSEFRRRQARLEGQNTTKEKSKQQ